MGGWTGWPYGPQKSEHARTHARTYSPNTTIVPLAGEMMMRVWRSATWGQTATCMQGYPARAHDLLPNGAASSYLRCMHPAANSCPCTSKCFRLYRMVISRHRWTQFVKGRAGVSLASITTCIDVASTHLAYVDSTACRCDHHHCCLQCHNAGESTVTPFASERGRHSVKTGKMSRENHYEPAPKLFSAILLILG